MSSIAWVDAAFPKAAGRYRKTSNTDIFHNCIAYAVGDTSDWWSHESGCKWIGVRSAKIEALVDVFAALGYRKCLCATKEKGFDKVALYCLNSKWTHASIQLETGKWSSKLGPDEDIEHDSPGCICNKFYGQVYCYMKRAKSLPYKQASQIGSVS